MWCWVGRLRSASIRGTFRPPCASLIAGWLPAVPLRPPAGELGLPELVDHRVVERPLPLQAVLEVRHLDLADLGGLGLGQVALELLLDPRPHRLDRLELLLVRAEQGLGLGPRPGAGLAVG